MTWLDMGEQRDAEGNLTDLALALNAISDVGCDCGTDEGGSCVGCLCEQALKGLWEQLDSAKAEIKRLRAHTWEQERAAAVAWLAKQENYAEDQEKRTHEEEARLYLEARVGTLAEVRCSLEGGEHWPEGGKG